MSLLDNCTSWNLCSKQPSEQKNRVDDINGRTQLLALVADDQEEVDKMKEFTRGILNQEFDSAEDYVPGTKEWLSSHWEGFKSPAQLSRIRNTGEHAEQRMCL